MKLEASMGSEARYIFAMMLPAAGYVGAKSDGPLVVFLALILFVLLCRIRTGGNAVSSLSLDSQELVAHFTIRSPVRIPLTEIAAVEVHRRSWFTRSMQPTAYITIFRKDEPAVVEIAAETADADRFLEALAKNAKLLGVKDVAPFTLPRSVYAYDLLPLLAALPIVLIVPAAFSWAGFAIALLAFVLHSLFTWSRYAHLRRQISAQQPAEDLDEWTLLIRTS